ncbi:MAG: MarR family winged helix-turn-helix transcriptional regulator [Marvinbryantia sp.]|jgi:DNA-binding MarR family transcriptional regulator
MNVAYKKINYILVDLINEIWELEEKAIITEEFSDLSNNDMHIIEAIGVEDGDNMSSVAKKRNITVGSLTTAVNHLVKKGYVDRSRGEEDRRIVMIRLTEKGRKAYWHHADYHRQMTEAVLEKLSEEELPVLFKMLDALTVFFKDYSQKMNK